MFPYPYFYMESKLLPMILIVLGGYVGYLLLIMTVICLVIMGFFSLEFVSDMWFIPYLTSKFSYRSFLLLGNKYSVFMDSGWDESVTSGLFSKLFYISYYNLIYQNNSINLYFVSFFLVFFFIVFF